jgi:hypothetical protein
MFKKFVIIYHLKYNDLHSTALKHVSVYTGVLKMAHNIYIT